MCIRDRAHIRAEEATLIGDPPNLEANVQEVQLSQLRPTEASSILRGPKVASSKQMIWERMISDEENILGDLPLCKRLVHCKNWWVKHAHLKALNLITGGIYLPNLPRDLTQNLQQHSKEELALATVILRDYAASGAVRKVKKEGTKHLIPWFILSKKEKGGMKHRLISDRREINNFVETKKFCLQNLQDIFPYLKQGQWAAKIDLKDAYFHIPLHPQMKHYLRMQVGGYSFKMVVLD